MSFSGVSSTQRNRRAFTLVELLVVIAIVIILLALLIPSINNSIASGRQTQCASRLRQLGQAFLIAGENGQNINSSNWTTLAENLIEGKPELLFCPEDIEESLASSFAMNSRAHRFVDEDGGRIVLLDYHTTEATLVVNTVSEQDNWEEDGGLYAARHLGNMNVLLHNGSVKAYAFEDIDPRVCELWLRYWRGDRDTQYNLDACGEPVEETGGAASSGVDPIKRREKNYPPVDPYLCGRNDPITMDDDDEGFTKENVPFLDFFGWDWAKWTYHTRNRAIASKNRSFGHGEDCYEAPGQQTEQTFARYEFSVEPGYYRLWGHWLAGSGRSTNTPYRVFDGDNPEPIYVERVDQSAESNGERIIYNNAYEDWHVFNGGEPLLIESDTLRVEIGADTHANGIGAFAGFQSKVVADAVRIDCVRGDYHADRCVDEEVEPIDDGGDGYTADPPSAWSNVTNSGSYGGGHAATPSGSGNKTVRYDFPSVTPGQYRVWTLFVPNPSNATDVPYSVYDGTKLLRTTYVNQSRVFKGYDLDGDGKQWYNVGEFEIRGDKLSVTISDGASGGTVTADAVRAECSFKEYGDSSKDCDNYHTIYGRECRRHYAEDYGATSDTEDALEAALNWISRHQFEDGGWNWDHREATCPYLKEPEPCNSECRNEGGDWYARYSATGMALLPFFGAGMGPDHEEYGEMITKGIEWMLYKGPAKPLSTGRLFMPGFGGHGAQGYEQALATWALCEAVGTFRQTGFGTLNEVDVAKAANQGVGTIMQCHFVKIPGSRRYGAIHYECSPNPIFADVSVCAWHLNALKSGAALGFNDSLPGGSRHAATRKFLDVMGELTEGREGGSTVIPDPAYGDYGTTYTYCIVRGDYHPARGSNILGRYCRALNGAPPQAAGMRESSRLTLQQGFTLGSYHDLAAAHFMRYVGGSNWDIWSEKMNEKLLATQELPDSGHKRGSWGTGGKVAGPCGRLFDTAAHSLCLEVYYRTVEGL